MNLSSLTSVKRINVLVTMQDIFYLRFNQLSYINLLIMLLNITYYCNIIVILNIIVFFFFLLGLLSLTSGHQVGCLKGSLEFFLECSLDITCG